MKARQIQESSIAHAPPHVREIWDWLLKECNHTPRKSSGRIVERGQCVRSYNDIREGLKWKIGYRTRKYTKWDCERAMKWLRKHTMIATTKTTRGLIITIVKYDYYQNPKNYESHNKATTKATTKPQTHHTINKNDNTLKNVTTLEGKMKDKKEKKLEKDMVIKKSITPTNKMFGVFQSIWLTKREKEYKFVGGKDGKTAQRVWRQCMKDNPNNPLDYFTERVRLIMEQHDIWAFGGIEVYWNSATPKKKGKSWIDE